MVVESARSRGRQRIRLTTLPGVERAGRVDRRAVAMGRMRIRRHLMHPVVIVHEPDAFARVDRDRRRADRAVRADGDRRADRPRAAPAASGIGRWYRCRPRRRRTPAPTPMPRPHVRRSDLHLLVTTMYSPRRPMSRCPDVPCCLIFFAVLEELPRDVESEVPVFAIEPAPRDLRHGGAEAVREIDLERVSARSHLDGETGIRDPRVVPEPWRRFGDEYSLGRMRSRVPTPTMNVSLSSINSLGNGFVLLIQIGCAYTAPCRPSFLETTAPIAGE